jgi:hypothetical protein
MRWVGPRPGSAVSITRVADPATHYLSDADALCTDGSVPDETLRRVLPGLLRLAIDAAARDRFYAGRLSHGDALVEVESMWDKAQILACSSAAFGSASMILATRKVSNRAHGNPVMGWGDRSGFLMPALNQP